MPFGWLGNALIIAGHWRLGARSRVGFLLGIAGGCCWIVEGVRIVKPDLIFIECVLASIALRNFLKWGKYD